MAISSGKVLSINITHLVHDDEWTGRAGKSGIDKRPVPGRISVKNDGVEGDFIGDRARHGGHEQAVYAYAHEDLIWWEGELGIKPTNGQFGENLTTSGVDVTNAIVGERWAIGSAILEVSMPRIPCRVFAGFWDRPTLIKDFIAAGRPGSYLRIVQEGDIGAGDLIEILNRPSHQITIANLFSAENGDRSRIADIAKVPELSDEYREWVETILISSKEANEKSGDAR